MNTTIKSHLLATFIATITAIVTNEALGVAFGSIGINLNGLQGPLIAIVTAVLGAFILQRLSPKLSLIIALASNICAYLVLNRVLAFAYAGLDSYNVVARIALITFTYWVGLFLALVVIEAMTRHFIKPRPAAH